MRFDLMAGTAAALPAPITRAPVVLVFDSGLGGLTVLAEVRRARPDARVVYAADDAAFPYGGLAEPVLVARVLTVMERLIALHARTLRFRLPTTREYITCAAPLPALWREAGVEEP